MHITKQHITAVAIAFLVIIAGCSGDDGTAEITDSTDTTTVETTSLPQTEIVTDTPSPSTQIPTDGDDSTTTTPTDTPSNDVTEDTDSTGETTTDDSSNDDSGVDSPIDGGNARQATVTRVIDGDTIEVEFESGETDTVRLLGVDTPETQGSVSPNEFGYDDTSAAQDHLRTTGEAAHHYVEERHGMEMSIRIVTDPESDRRGSYNRLLAYVYVDNTNLNAELLKKGYARHYESDFTKNSAFATLEDEARSNDRKVWDFTQPDSGDSSDTQTEEQGSIADKDCGDFDTRGGAQSFFESHNPDDDPHRLDRDGDGQACESLG